MQLWQILIPTMDNEGHVFLSKDYDDFANKIIKELGISGLTILPRGTGYWVGSGKQVQQEPMIPILIGCMEHEIQIATKLVAEQFKQNAVAYWKVSDSFYIDYY
jgi:hypothetical protein